jgi:alkylation response protein AidB-like acyl-CoA dehydrogenase
MIAERRAEINAAKLMVLDTANKIDKFGSKDSKIEISIIKFYCANVLKRVVDDAVQIHGGLGMSDDIILSHFYRHERAARIYDGADEVHISSVAKGILSNYGLKI